jgi:hypothetical protein
MRARLLALLAFAVALAAGPSSRPALADSWNPYGKRRVPDPTGRWYVVLGPDDQGAAARFLFVEARAGSDPVPAIRDRPDQETKDAVVREGDAVVAKGTLPSAPLEVRVSSLGHGFAAMVEHANVGGGDSFAWVARDGAVKHVKRMADLFSPEEIRAFTHTTSSVWWFHAAWIDETSKEVMIVGNGGVLRAVGIDGGKVRQAGDAEVGRAVSSLDPEAAIPALDLAISRHTPGLEEALRLALADAERPLGVRLRAAAALADRGDRRGLDLLRSTAAVPTPPAGDKELRGFALRALPRALGEEATSTLRAAMGPPTDPTAWSGAMEGFATLGEKAVPALVAMLAEKDRGNDYRGGAAYVLGRVGTAAVLPPLLAAVVDPEEYVANAALNAAAAIGKGTISKELAALLDRGTTQDGRLASYFTEFREPASVEPLRRALARHAKDEYPRNVILESLRFQGALPPLAPHEHGPK